MRAGFNGSGYIQQRYNPRAHNNAATPMARAATAMAHAQMGQHGGGQLPPSVAALIQHLAGHMQHPSGGDPNVDPGYHIPDFQPVEDPGSMGQPGGEAIYSQGMEQAAQDQALQQMEQQMGTPAIFAHLKNQASIGTPGPVRSVLDKVRNNRGAIHALIEAAMNSHAPGRMFRGPVDPGFNHGPVNGPHRLRPMTSGPMNPGGPMQGSPPPYYM